MLIVCYIVIGSGINSYLAQIDKKKKKISFKTHMNNFRSKTYPCSSEINPNNKNIFFSKPISNINPYQHFPTKKKYTKPWETRYNGNSPRKSKFKTTQMIISEGTEWKWKKNKYLDGK